MTSSTIVYDASIDTSALPTTCLTELAVCCPGSGGGNFFPISAGEFTWPVGLRAVLYFVGMAWCFLGVAIIADLFMAAIDQITSATKITKNRDGKRTVTKVWNPVVANLSLMALGSSAPEILLNVVEITTGGFMAGALGPSTIVGSAAFNLLVILGVCVAAITEGTRRIEEMKVYAITAVTSMFAYIWLLIMLLVWTPDRITIVEGVLTFAMFWVLLFVCYAADKNFFRKKPVVSAKNEADARAGGQLVDADEAASALDNAGGIDDVTVKNTLKMAGNIHGLDDFNDDAKVDIILESLRPVTAATHTRNTMSWLTGKRPRAVFNKATGEISGLARRGIDGTSAVAKGALSTLANAASFTGSPLNPKGSTPLKASNGQSPSTANMGAAVAKVYFQEEVVDVMEDCGSVTLVVRRSGHMGEVVSINYETADISATAGKDYEAQAGTLTFQADQREATLTILIIDDDRFEQHEQFRVSLKDPSEGCELDGTKGGIAMVTILNDDEIKSRVLSLLETRLNRDKFAMGMAEWKQQFADAIRPGAEADAPPGAAQYAIHAVTVVFKVTFALVPPVCFGGGWPAFAVSLSFIAVMTVIVGDLAELFGCVIGLDASFTAITFVALGTSMPDLFASKTAATSEPTADCCVGNVTGSNCVNVFLGLGLPWTIAAIYWASVGTNNALTDEWAAKYGHLPAVQEYLEDHPGGAYFLVQSGSLGFSVIVFSVCSLACLVTLYVRRQLYGGELGGPKLPRNATAAFFTFLWFAYILLSAFKIYGIIS